MALGILDIANSATRIHYRRVLSGDQKFFAKMEMINWFHTRSNSGGIEPLSPAPKDGSSFCDLNSSCCFIHNLGHVQDAVGTIEFNMKRFFGFSDNWATLHQSRRSATSQSKAKLQPVQ